MYSALFGDKLPLMTSYTTFFGLKKEPFAKIAAGNDVFVAPQVASAMAAVKKALVSQDSVVAVSGPVGSGKTTITRRALEKSAEFHIIVTIGRIQFAHDEVLELLLAVQKWELLSLVFEIFYILHFVQTVLLDAREARKWEEARWGFRSARA